MEPAAAKADSLRVVTNALAGVSGPEIRGGAQDGGVDGLMVIAQLEVISLRDAASERRDRAEILHLGLTREAALDVAQRLAKAAAMLPRS